MKRKTFTRLFVTLMSLMLIVSFLPTTVFAADVQPVGNWMDYASDSFAGGSGTKDDPYQIATEEQFAKLAKDVNEGNNYSGIYFILENDINLSSHIWTPIGTDSWIIDDDGNGITLDSPKYFSGFFDGNEKTISGLYVDERGTTHNDAGLFGNIRNINSNEAGVKDLTITDATIYSSEAGLMENRAGILVGSAVSNPGREIVISNVTVSGSVTVESTYGSNKIGGMAGETSSVNFTDCHVQNIQISYASNTGGFVGMAMTSTFTDCSATGTIEGLWGLGGFAGYATDQNSNPTAQEDVSTFTKCRADVDISGDDWRIGGFVGFLECGNIIECVADGDITSNLNDILPKAGGFVGEMANADFPIYANYTSIQNSHASGVTIAENPMSPAGGFVGSYSGGSLENCSYDIEKNSSLESVGGSNPEDLAGIKGLSTAQVNANICIDYYEGHDFSTEWIIDSPATCTDSGIQSHYCTRCGEQTDITIIPALGHTLTHTEAKSASCTEEGNEEYWTCNICGKHFSDAEGKVEISIEDTVISKIEHSYVDGKCSVCGEIDKNFQPAIIAGANGIWQKGGADGLSFTSNAGFADFVKVQVDAKDVTASNYELKEGSTIVTLKASYLETLSAGNHTLAIVSDTGTATTTFTIKTAPVTNDEPQSPQTSDDSNITLWITVLLAAGAVLAGTILYSRKKKYNKE